MSTTRGRPECFVCLRSDGRLYRVCKCNAHVHAHCLRTTIERVVSHHETCAVCKESYRDVVFVHGPQMLPSHRALVGAHVVFVLLSTSYTVLLVTTRLGDARWAFVVLWALAAAALGVYHRQVRAATGRALCCRWRLQGLRVARAG